MKCTGTARLALARKQRSDEGMAEGHRTITVDGNRLTLLPEGPQRLDALIELIDRAKASLRLLYYIYRGDRSGTAVRDALVRAAGRGRPPVRCRAQQPHRGTVGRRDRVDRAAQLLPSRPARAP